MKPLLCLLLIPALSLYAQGKKKQKKADNPEGPQFAYRTGDILMPEVKFAEPVRVEAEHFLDCIRNSQEPLTGLAHARTVVSILERARPLNGEVKHGNLTA